VSHRRDVEKREGKASTLGAKHSDIDIKDSFPPQQKRIILIAPQGNIVSF
jgi:hypothetical protein